MKLCKMIEIYLKYDNMHTIRTINAFIWINNHVNSCIKCMLSREILGEIKVQIKKGDKCLTTGCEPRLSWQGSRSYGAQTVGRGQPRLATTWSSGVFGAEMGLHGRHKQQRVGAEAGISGHAIKPHSACGPGSLSLRVKHVGERSRAR